MIVRKIENQYSLVDKFYLFIRLIKTKIFFPRQRLIRRNFEIRGRKMVHFGRGLTTGVGCRIEAFVSDGNKGKKIILGNKIQINDYVHISALESITIGNDVLIASHVYISDNSHGSYKIDDNDTSPNIRPTERPYYTSPVKIGNNVWIGEGVIILPGVSIGDGSIIGAHSIVNNNIPANSIAVGSPVKIIKKWNTHTNHWEKV